MNVELPYSIPIKETCMTKFMNQLTTIFEVLNYFGFIEDQRQFTIYHDILFLEKIPIMKCTPRI